MRVPPALVAAVLIVLVAPTAFPAAVHPSGDKLPRAIVGASGVYVDGKHVVLGGRIGDGTYVDSILQKTPGGALLTLGALPTAAGERPGRYAGTAVAIDGVVYYFGGATLKEMSVPDGRGGTTQAYVPTASKQIIRVDPATGAASFLDVDTLRKPAFGMSSVVFNGRAYLFGGFYFDFSDPHPIQRLDTITVFDPRAAAGSRVRPIDSVLPYAVQDAAAAVLGSRVYLMGGLSDNDNTTNRCVPEPRWVQACITNKIVVWSPDAESTPPRVVGELPYRVEFTQAPVVNGKAYLIGGLLTDQTGATSIVEIAPTGSIGQVTTRVLVPTIPQGRFGAAVVNDGRNVTLYGGRLDFNDDVVLDTVVRVEPGPTPPWAPRNASAAHGARGVRITWEPPRYDGETIVSAYNVYRGPAGTNGTLVGTTPNLAYDDDSACPGIETLWRVTAMNARGESDAATSVSFTPQTVPPPAPTNVTAYGGNGFAVVRWRPPVDECEVAVSGYSILRDGQLVARTGPVLEYRDTSGIVNGRAYSYQVRAYNARGDGPVSDVARAFPAEVPGAPHSLFASVLNASVQITWSPPEEPVTYYLVNRSFSPGSPGQQVGNVTSTTFEDATLERGRTYFYTVRAVNIAGQSPPSEIVASGLVRKPGAPTDVTALGRAGEVLLAWQAPIDTGDAPASAVRYLVTRAGGGAERPINVKTDIEGIAFRDRNVTPGFEYTYTVTTLNPLSSEPSASASATPLVLANTKPTSALSAFPIVALSDEPIEFDASQSADADGTIREYVFDFGDGTDVARTASSFVRHSYHQNGTYTATVVVKDDRGAQSPPAQVRVVVGEIAPTPGMDQTGGLGGPTARPTGVPTSRPGSETPEAPVPGFEVAALALALALALASARRHRPK